MTKVAIFVVWDYRDSMCHMKSMELCLADQAEHLEVIHSNWFDNFWHLFKLQDTNSMPEHCHLKIWDLKKNSDILKFIGNPSNIEQVEIHQTHHHSFLYYHSFSMGDWLFISIQSFFNFPCLGLLKVQLPTACPFNNNVHATQFTRSYIDSLLQTGPLEATKLKI